ncbi:MAG TPA: tetratricopeptide repeat protein [Bacteroidota bacterium]|nr:tetratricopeptide repeat protein [Bacteroidota bacterium]
MVRSLLNVLCIPLSLLSHQADPRPVDWGAVHAVTMRGIDRLYNMKIDEAAATFDSVRRMAPGDPRGYFFGSMVHFWLFTLTRDEKEYSTFLAKSDDVITVCENLLDVNDKDAVSLFYLGGMYGYRGLAHQAHNSMFKAVTEGRKGYLSLKEAVRLKPDLYDAQMGFGLFTYLVAKVPKSLSWVLSLVGFSGDAEAGLAMVRRAADQGIYTRTEARFYLSQFLFAEGKSEEALPILDTLIAQYPENPLFVVTYASWQSRLGNTDVALRAAGNAVEINRRSRIHYGEEFVLSTLGAIYYAMNDFPNARSHLEEYLRRVPSEDYITNWTYYRLAVSQELTGDREAALVTYARMKSVDDRDRAGETYMYRVARRRMHGPITAVEALLIRGGNDLGRKAYDSAMSLYRRALDSSGTDLDARARALLGLQQVFMAKDDYASALRAGEELVSLKPPVERWTIPQGLLQLGGTLEKLGRPGDARSAYQKVLEFDDYDFQKPLEEKARSELGRLKSGG